MRFLFAVLILVPSVALAQLDVSVKKAKAVTTSVTIDVTQVQTEDGTPIGRSVEKEGQPVVRDGVNVAIIFVKTQRPIGELLVKLKCKTCDPYLVEPGVYAVTKPGKHEIEVNVIGQNPLSWDDETVLVEVGQGPNPPPPGPDPPGPTPGPAPIDGQGLRVLFVVESSEANLLTSGQQQVLYGEQVRSYLNQYCAKGTDSKQTPEWRIMDPDSKFTAADNKFAKALARPRASLPWIVISNGTSGYEGPLPASPEEAVFLIDQYNTAKTGGANR